MLTKSPKSAPVALILKWRDMAVLKKAESNDFDGRGNNIFDRDRK